LQFFYFIDEMARQHLRISRRLLSFKVGQAWRTGFPLRAILFNGSHTNIWAFATSNPTSFLPKEKKKNKKKNDYLPHLGESIVIGALAALF